MPIRSEAFFFAQQRRTAGLCKPLLLNHRLLSHIVDIMKVSASNTLGLITLITSAALVSATGSADQPLPPPPPVPKKSYTWTDPVQFKAPPGPPPPRPLREFEVWYPSDDEKPKKLQKPRPNPKQRRSVQSELERRRQKWRRSIDEEAAIMVRRLEDILSRRAAEIEGLNARNFFDDLD
ncbi:hypothetical protein H0H87_008499 [Tephrocybe sp. NHM501043]|nr:hypothetical protein H0H87_008499 [Tephrocybe sp. NHM501043]